ncbi:MAG: SPFH domain / Band 7 family protein [Candidatus Scalindua rubra]|uniref:SPFH domain / Band 7 family protein n=1 Tax=Candidatus Scalindua rubra TaxID=1872076 RepID=A0A1E3XFU7_9BACT|nr:MAG: SPFH domain / Band 7 family protein [Candidatus Scalindua rubra]
MFSLVSGKHKTYGPGGHFCVPWEQLTHENIDMRIRHLPFDGLFPSKEGPKVSVTFSLQYKPLLNRLPTYISIDKTVLNEGMLSIISSHVCSFIANHSIGSEAIEIHNRAQKLKDYLSTNLKNKDSFVELYGIEIVEVPYVKIRYEERYRKVLTNKGVSEKVMEIATRLSSEEITVNQALNIAMVINGDIKKHITEWEGSGIELGYLALASFLKKLAKNLQQ